MGVLFVFVLVAAIAAAVVYGEGGPAAFGGPEPYEICEVCHRDIDDCLCPVCPVCGEQGNPRCYADHGLRRPVQ